jgi:hypothetical protein
VAENKDICDTTHFESVRVLSRLWDLEGNAISYGLSEVKYLSV